ncbi:putative lipid II flippase FtsW [Ignatzschineria cameli]|uniref:Probable peptidoglycan glycosyltransferase FtsW n=1 Tax=Ignatzschineria cameli TaxID=2182793 RepID=A0A2U2AS72_9GAMM|nr:putative lipid II flippase FtsW [Ignatzschineria cameli]PWD86536.1 putative lipid II flippase FtsW [Ignatzschineria cameli]PWD87111.1 putative lipid II flippase FtsW [Ignatzschineria cameli]PWD92084.1 putative lipid II flippase FtsW [Ignatzschineria cameli]PWD93331.1 putative lipid II flippase FtsW [Ignatzschineria cameli]PWD94073.1 putative lipid II flippase FtsW [Ignatzschineria cameli]
MSKRISRGVRFDPWLLVTSSLFLLIGLLMVTTASGYVAEYYGLSPYHYGIRQGLYIAIGLTFGILAFKIKLNVWYKLTPVLMLFSFVTLILVLIPGIGREVNGALRWIPISFFNFQPAEVAKFAALTYIASYLHRQKDRIGSKISALIIPLFVMAVLGVLLLLEPDFGSTAIIFVVGLGLLFIAGVCLWRFAIVLAPTLIVMAVILYTSPYRRARLSGFLRPWEDAYNQGYQLVNSLIAIGRGKLSGVGIGESMSKLGYLPEAHTDFIFAIYAEEFGFFGVIFLVLIYMIFLYRTFNIGRRAEQLNLNFAAYISYGIGLWLGTQALIHMCVASGLLPTKGLTLPLMSYGGSSIITMMVGLGLLFRVDRVVQLKELQNYQDEQEAAAQREIEESKIRVAMK